MWSVEVKGFLSICQSVMRCKKRLVYILSRGAGMKCWRLRFWSNRFHLSMGWLSFNSWIGQTAKLNILSSKIYSQLNLFLVQRKYTFLIEYHSGICLSYFLVNIIIMHWIIFMNIRLFKNRFFFSYFSYFFLSKI